MSSDHPPTSQSHIHIHILGLGSIGCFVAHALRSLPSPPRVTLLLHREGLHQDLAARDGKLSLQIREDGPVHETSGYDWELLPQQQQQQQQKSLTTDPPIHCLIVTVKASAMIAALHPIKHRLGKASTICLFQNGMGQIEALDEEIFPDPATRPAYMFGIVRHGVYLAAPFHGILAGLDGTITIGEVERSLPTNPNPNPNPNPAAPSTTPSPSTTHLSTTLLTASLLNGTLLPWSALLPIQLHKLAANCVLNPLTALLDVRNGAILQNPSVWPLQRQLVEEISAVFLRLPELAHLGAEARTELFSVRAIEDAVRGTVEKTAANSSSMREDVRRGRETEIRFINGLLFSLALTGLGLADKTCTPSFDYCSDQLLNSKGFTTSDLNTALQGTGYENEDLKNILFHCTNPGAVGHAKLCANGCKDSAQEGSHGCDG
ncbi:hypothetical protein BO70DRAFT_426196 [Aspergillus heteromorphus CBS 117.55]|uniref:2-dehydropantoate 2-reductase n=1 Tax=Aspergillus heteromorphus CBS 117.55 TaxID=1448321 RepID=A0A317WWQ3_9EURO|nr:uncharacterized protein BO70DRAFT_426196 [Aspergillus heteromorphus CBS 117.55]PWY89742.1 hypothetical protein BO70DRAFT_426196 [Aspergillus heteromorphus CBS 117.55]